MRKIHQPHLPNPIPCTQSSNQPTQPPNHPILGLQGNGDVTTAWASKEFNDHSNAAVHCKNFVKSLRDGSSDEVVISLLALAVGAYIRPKTAHETVADYCSNMHTALAQFVSLLADLGNPQAQRDMIGAGVAPAPNALSIDKVVGAFSASKSQGKTGAYQDDVMAAVDGSDEFVFKGSVPAIATLSPLTAAGRKKTLLFCVPANKHDPPHTCCDRVQGVIYTGEWVQGNRW